MQDEFSDLISDICEVGTKKYYAALDKFNEKFSGCQVDGPHTVTFSDWAEA